MPDQQSGTSGSKSQRAQLNLLKNGGSIGSGSGAGGGWLTSGGGGTLGGHSIINSDGFGGDNGDVDGGFGSGGASATDSGSDTEGGGGGGGYSGGGTDCCSSDPGGGGGGSYNAGTNQDNASGVNAGPGQVTITFIEFPAPPAPTRTPELTSADYAFVQDPEGFLYLEVPEPRFWVSLLAGVVLLGWLQRRRRRN